MAGTPGRSGGRRRGRQGRPYPNRKDLRAQPARAAPNQEYGQAGAQLQSQQQQPLPQAASGAPPPSALAGMVGGGSPQPVVGLTDPTARPNEPLKFQRKYLN